MAQTHTQTYTAFIIQYKNSTTLQSNNDHKSLRFSNTLTHTEKKQCLPIKHNEEVKDTTIHSQPVWQFYGLTCGNRSKF